MQSETRPSDETGVYEVLLAPGSLLPLVAGRDAQLTDHGVVPEVTIGDRKYSRNLLEAVPYGISGDQSTATMGIPQAMCHQHLHAPEGSPPRGSTGTARLVRCLRYLDCCPT
ncbi:MAG: hypothetical protein QXG03_00420, partial [Halalkalicoccus sp.]